MTDMDACECPDCLVILTTSQTPYVLVYIQQVDHSLICFRGSKQLFYVGI